MSSTPSSSSSSTGEATNTAAAAATTSNTVLPSPSSNANTIQFAQEIVSPKDVCSLEARTWRLCLEPYADRKATPKHKPAWSDCSAERDLFAVCMANWRASIGDTAALVDPEDPKYDPTKIKMRIRQAPGLPAPQCGPISCLTEKCIFTAGGWESCTPFLKNFKFCVQKTWGEEYC